MMLLDREKILNRPKRSTEMILQYIINPHGAEVINVESNKIIVVLQDLYPLGDRMSNLYVVTYNRFYSLWSEFSSKV